MGFSLGGFLKKALNPLSPLNAMKGAIGATKRGDFKGALKAATLGSLSGGAMGNVNEGDGAPPPPEMGAPPPEMGAVGRSAPSMPGAGGVPGVGRPSGGMLKMLQGGGAPSMSSSFSGMSGGEGGFQGSFGGLRRSGGFGGGGGGGMDEGLRKIIEEYYKGKGGGGGPAGGGFSQAGG